MHEKQGEVITMLKGLKQTTTKQQQQNNSNMKTKSKAVDRAVKPQHKQKARLNMKRPVVKTP